MPQDHPQFTPSHMAMDDAIVAAVRARLPATRAVYRYGSAGGPFERDDSDVDIAILADKPLSFETRAALVVDLMRLVDRDVDLVDMGGIPVTLKIQIVASGARLYTADFPDVEDYETRVFSDYARLNEERRGILEDVRQRGRVYG